MMGPVDVEFTLNGGFVDHHAMIKESILSRSRGTPDAALLEQITINEEGGTVYVDCPTVFIQKHLCRVYRDLIIQEVRSHLEGRVEVEFRLGLRDKPSEPVPARPVQMSLPALSEAQASTGLNAHFTFDEFVVGKCNAFAFEAAQTVSDGGSARYNPLFFYSDIGLGKSHIAHAIGNKLLAIRPGTPVRYVTARDFAHHYVHSVRNDCMKSFKSRYCSTAMDVLFIDDVHLFRNKEKTQIELCHVLDDLIGAGKQVILSGFRPPASIPQIDKGLRSRFSAGLIIDIKRPDKDTRFRIVRRKALKNGVDIPDDVAEFVSTAVHTNIRDLESAVMNITAVSSLMKRPVTIDLAKELLEGAVSRRQALTIATIQDLVSRSFSVPMEKLVSSSRRKEVIYPRQVAIYLCRRYTEEPLQVIGEAFMRKHSSVIHSLETIENRYNQDLKVKRDIDFLMDKIESELA